MADADGYTTITLADLLPQMQAAAAKMGVKNPTKRLLWIAAQMLVQQAREIVVFREAEEKRQQSRIILPS